MEQNIPQLPNPGCGVFPVYFSLQDNFLCQTQITSLETSSTVFFNDTTVASFKSISLVIQKVLCMVLQLEIVGLIYRLRSLISTQRLVLSMAIGR
jgi:hypothetical protein